MAATIRLLRNSKLPFHPYLPHSSSSSSSMTMMKCQSKEGAAPEKMFCVDHVQKRSSASVKASTARSETVVTSQPQTDRLIDLAALLASVTDYAIKFSRIALKRKSRRFHAEVFIKNVIINCRFFTLFAVVGSLLGSVLCFVEGCFIVIESYLQYFHAISQKSDQGHVVELLIEAIDMFLVGTAMLIFGTSLYVMFVGSKNLKERGPWLPRSNFFGLFHLNSLPPWVQMQSVSQAKSKIGHAVMMILQVGVLEKIKNVPLVTGLDLACFAGSILLSSACIFVLSRLSVGSIIGKKKSTTK